MTRTEFRAADRRLPRNDYPGSPAGMQGGEA